MSKKNALLVATLAFALCGIVMLAYPFVASMRPVERIPDNALTIDVSTMRPNTSRIIITKHSKKIKRQASTTWMPGSSLLVVRDDANNFYLYLLPIWEGKVIMPWRSWWQHEGYCADFGLTSHNGKFLIKCGTPNYAEFLTKQWYWDINGQNLGDDLPHLMSVHFIREGEKLYAYQR